ncbi:MAG TPA: hypothetical protein VHY91_22345 [Pirellulales bacterium]|nr:hypothetical protein [Pirellulales bacterium]
MPISVVCPGCKARFNVSDKFAGKKGPCPKCKTVLTVPMPAEEVKIHVPEEYASGGKDSKGRAVGKPIPRLETKLQPVLITLIGAVVLGSLGICLLAKYYVPDKTALIIVGLAFLSPAVAVGGYSFLREEELEPYRGTELWIRATICGAVYAVLWGIYLYIRPYLPGELYQWLLVAPPIIGVGALAALATFDLDYGSGALHYCFYLLMTLILASTMGLAPLSAPVPDSQQTAAEGIALPPQLR